MDDIFQAIENNDMVLAIKSLRLKGKAKCVFALLKLLSTTKPIENDYNWWGVRALVLANDKDLIMHKLSMEQRLAMRIN